MMKIVIIGAGKLARSLAPLINKVATVVQVCSRTLDHARELAAAVGCDNAIDDLTALVVGADYYMIATGDDAIAGVVDATADNGGVWFHTSGSCPIDVFADKRTNYGVLYPLYSFKGEPLGDFVDIPTFIEANDSWNLGRLATLARAFSDDTTVMDSEARRHLHLAAVMTCNFTNHIWSLAHKAMPADVPFDVMQPMLEDMLENLRLKSPVRLQTGPALRGDRRTMAAHLAMLDGTARDVYSLLSRSIAEEHNVPLLDDVARGIRGIAFDVDGVLSTSTIPMHPSGEPMRMANIKDGYAIQLAVKLGLHVAIISGARVEAIRVRYESLGVQDVYLGAGEKLPVLYRWMESRGLMASEVAFAGDDIPDIPVLRAVALPVAPADAVPEARAAARWVLPCDGGYGVARAVIERVLRARGQWLDDTHAFGW